MFIGTDDDNDDGDESVEERKQKLRIKAEKSVQNTQ